MSIVVDQGTNTLQITWDTPVTGVDPNDPNIADYISGIDDFGSQQIDVDGSTLTILEFSGDIGTDGSLIWNEPGWLEFAGGKVFAGESIVVPFP